MFDQINFNIVYLISNFLTHVYRSQIIATVARKLNKERHARRLHQQDVGNAPLIEAAGNALLNFERAYVNVVCVCVYTCV